MTLATLPEVLRPAADYAVPGFVCLGWEDMRAFAAAANLERAPIILQAGPSCRAHTPLAILGAMFRHLAADADVPIVAHLDHGASLDECRAAIDAGFTSVMYDGSKLPLAQNIDLTARVAEMAHAAGAGVEGEIGFVGYDAGAQSLPTDPDQAAEFAKATGVDAMAVSVGNVHLQTSAGGGIDMARLAAIGARTDTPLVIHGGSGVPLAERAAMARGSNVRKFNFGTELRQVFGTSLRAALQDGAFDRIQILRQTEAPMTMAARAVIRSVLANGRG